MSKQKHILCIDDEPGMVELVNLVLKAGGFTVEGAYSGEQGLALMRQQRPDLVLLDIMMPEMDGWDVYKTMRADPELQDIPVIIITARDSSFEEIIARTRAGVDDYIIKPFLPDELRQSVADVLAQTSTAS